ncbi:MAG: HNH endonuclease, partial [Gemmataceae bacterium]
FRPQASGRLAGSLVSGGPQHGQILAHPSKPTANTPSRNRNQRDINVELGSKTNEVVSGPPGQGTGSERDLAILGPTPSSSHESLHSETEVYQQHHLRPCDLCRVLNSTVLGKVLNERQLHRHRNAAGRQVNFGRRVDLLRYVAWLVLQRHGPTRPGRRCRKSNGGAIVNIHDVLTLIKNQQFRCALTGRLLEPDTASLDHVVPVSRGGPHSIDNAQALHKDVNRAKGTLTNDEFIELCREVVRFTSRKAQKKEAHTHEG